ncbi:MAG: peptide chain release factor N(5)-glutamine methyltransferase [Verrucomicrobia bacterium]|nr:peptide chain release factor N(5)-glutamine methyltransferase [Verrucomicrobiota bacterium]
MVTVLELIQNTTAFFQRKGVESPRLSIEYLLAEALGKRRLDLYLDYDQRLPEQILEPLRDKVRRRSEGEPLQHLLGSWEFFGRRFRTDRRALIPRPETERLAELIFSQIPVATSPGTRLADIGTGSGVLAITLALERPGLEVVATDLSADTLALARENARVHEVDGRITWLETDLLSRVDTDFDFLVANLPYVPTAEIAKLSREVQHDPPMALDGGEDGLDVIRQFAEQAPSHLKPGGSIYLEIGISQSSGVVDLLGKQKFRDISVEKDYQGVERFVIARYG